MISYTKRGINLVSAIISIILLFSINYIYAKQLEKQDLTPPQEIMQQKEETKDTKQQKESVNQTKVEVKKQETTLTTSKKTQEFPWEIEIPKIHLKASIREGTTQQVMNQYVGHFSNTSLWEGNVGLAAHNRGYPVNYFKDLKSLQIGDLITYRTEKGNKNYKVILHIIIKDEDWTYLKATKDNRITLITCVEDQPDYRRCIQALEEKK